MVDALGPVRQWLEFGARFTLSYPASRVSFDPGRSKETLLGG